MPVFVRLERAADASCGVRLQSTQRTYDRIVDGIGAVLLTLKKRPVIRYSQTCAPRRARGGTSLMRF